ncbi:MAG: SUF system NifU family Fe-S cluster assembly protein [Acidimicrobiaceae bacterium]|nr:SUF system NifU family Fe-S cluster assembly protein [Acidimicrobiaceae bacterium]MDE0516270.1 SUF system NifU family Fe-S cluster assembly protein [Acidimicrobiaceae bacterium]MDE0657092.1 SUF system NifU family Fe-S cluster assembly protein [Acidimicrobiaceae bacterium]MXZ96752.1 SUF system NifU family Fe-S cluster assembly protein [Acidimicrobiaceae bacterium]MYF43096.1 SUF system NifU family Fe-S cluster assembly protein [Acidimicrobiaceae bacterium]
MAGLEDLYREIILDHYRNPRNRGELEVPPAVQAVGFNPLCGDEVIVYVDVQDGVITDVSTGGQGCSISQSSASMMSTAIKGRSVAEARRMVRAFKHMMSIHGTGIGGTGDDLDDDGDSGNGAGDVKLGDLEALRGVVKFPVRIKCATLSWNTLVQALDETFA